jgi:hypothetical protein
MKRVWAGVVAAGLTVGLAVVGFGVARAQTAEPESSTTTTAPAAPGDKDAVMKRRLYGFGPGGFGFGKFGGGAIHGEVTSPKSDGGYQTMAFQTGEVTSVSKSSIALKSDDGFTRTYKLDEDTLVNAGRDGIDSVKNGDEVRVLAVVEERDARAVHVLDTTRVERARERWRPGRPRN